MAEQERARQRLATRLHEVLGEEAADTLVASLPPFAWPDVATKADLRALEERMDARFAQVDARFGELEGRLLAAFRAELVSAVVGQTRMTVFALLGTFATAGGLAITAAKVLAS